MKKFSQQLNWKRALVACLVVSCLLWSCSPTLSEAAATPTIDYSVENQDANLVVYVLNASQATPEMDIQVLIDDAYQVSYHFVSGGSQMDIALHRRYYFSLPWGTHTLKISSPDLGVAHEQEISLRKKTYILIGYDYQTGTDLGVSESGFTVLIQNDPFYFQ